MRITLPTGTPASLTVPDEASMGLVIATDLWGLRPLFDEHVERLRRAVVDGGVCGRAVPRARPPAGGWSRAFAARRRPRRRCPPRRPRSRCRRHRCRAGRSDRLLHGRDVHAQGGPLRSLRPPRRLLRDDPRARRTGAVRVRASRSITSPPATPERVLAIIGERDPYTPPGRRRRARGRPVSPSRAIPTPSTASPTIPTAPPTARTMPLMPSPGHGSG